MIQILQNAFKSNKTLLKIFFPLMAVIALQQLTTLAVNLADNLMLGAYSESAMSGAALVNQLQFMLQQLVAGIGAGVAVLGAQYWGKGDSAAIRSIISIGLKVSLAAGLVFFLVSAAMPAQVLGLLTNDAAIISEGVHYLRLMCWTYLIYSVSAVLVYSLQSVKTASIGTFMALCTLVINTSLNYCLIFGNFGFPKLGIAGAAIATLTSRIIELLIILVYVLAIDKKLNMKIKHLILFDPSLIRSFIKVSMPMMLTGALWGVAQTAQTAILGHIGAVALAANSIASVVFQLFAVFGMSCANAASVTIGSTIGAGRIEAVKPYTKTLQIIFLIIGVLSGATLFLCRNAIVGIYAVSEETRKMAVTYLTILSITTVGTCYEYPVEAGIIAGGGDTKYAAIVDNTFMWLFTIPCAALSAFLVGFSPIITFTILKADQLLKCIPNAIRCNRFKWIRDLTQASRPTPSNNH